MADGAPGLFEFMKEAREFFDGPNSPIPPQGAQRTQAPPDGVIDIEATVVEVVNSPVSGAAPPSAESQSAPRVQSGPGFTLHISPEHLLERLAWVIGVADQFHDEVTAAKASESFTNTWRLWYRDILVWRKRVEVAQGANASKADYDKLDAILQRLSKWHARLDKERHALDKDKGDGLPWYVWGGIIVGGFYAAKNILGGFLSDMVS
jgi:hypothetical protein